MNLLNKITALLCLGVAFTPRLLAVDSEPHLKTKVCNSAETFCTDVRNDLDAYKRFTVDAYISNSSAISVVPTAANILKQSEITVATKVESDLSGSTYTIPGGKNFRLMTFGGSYDTQSPMYLRLKKQTACTGSWVTQFRITLKMHGQDESNFQITMPSGYVLATAGDCLKITYTSDLSKGTLWAGFTGVEY